MIAGGNIASEARIPLRQQLIVSAGILALSLAHAILFLALKLPLLVTLDFLADLTGQEIKDLTAVCGLR